MYASLSGIPSHFPTHLRNSVQTGGKLVYGVKVCRKTRCQHYHSILDVVAIRFRCCGAYFGCHKCHIELAGHMPQIWPKDRFDEKAVLCGVCKSTLTIKEYLSCESQCLKCDAFFNPACKQHWNLYFQI